MHNNARRKCEALMNDRQKISVSLTKQTDESQRIYRIRLSASVDCIRFLLHQGLPFRGHDESDESYNQGNFLQLLKFLASHNDEINKVVLHNAPENHKLTSPKIQKDIVSAIAFLTTKEIVKDIGDDVFSLLVDESSDVSTKEQMAMVCRYVNDRGEIIECFLGLVHVGETTALTLRAGIDVLFTRYGLSINKLRGQGYDGASNMRGEFNGLKSIIMSENPSAYYIHCFAHQLQLVLVAVSKNLDIISSLFESVTSIMNTLGGSCKRRDVLRTKELDRVTKELESGMILSGRGLNQELGVKRACDTRWGSHHGVLENFHRMFSSIIDVLDHFKVDGLSSKLKHRARVEIDVIQTFEFVFMLLLMERVLSITADLSESLQRKDQDIVNAMRLVKFTKIHLTSLRNNDGEWESFLEGVVLLCKKNLIQVPDMNDDFVESGTSRRRLKEKKTNLHHYRFEIFNIVIDMLLSELNDRFNERNTELLLCASCFDPSDKFAAFDKNKLMRLAEFYPSDFTAGEFSRLSFQLNTYILDMRDDIEFAQVNGISGLAIKLVEQKRVHIYHLVYRLLKLVLLLPVATVTVERVFSAMNIIKTRLRNKIGDEFLNDCLVSYIERDVVNEIDNEAIFQQFQGMNSRRGTLSRRETL